MLLILFGLVHLIRVEFMQFENTIPSYLENDFFMFLENIESYNDPENPELLKNYTSGLFEQLKINSSSFAGMVDQLALAIFTMIKIDTKKIKLISLEMEPDWQEVRPIIGVHPNARRTISEIMEHSEDELKFAVLLIHLYQNFDSSVQNIKSESSEYDSLSFNTDY